MKISFENFGPIACTLKVIREKNDKKIRHETQILYHVKLFLNNFGFNLVQRKPSEDGHLTGAARYLRCKHRNNKPFGPAIAIHDPMYAIRDAAQDYNSEGKVNYTVIFDYFDNQKDCRKMVEKIAQKVNGRSFNAFNTHGILKNVKIKRRK